MKILITGSSGYVGSALTQKLLKKDHQLFLLSRKKTAIEPSEKIVPIVGDLLDPNWDKELPQEIDVAYFLVHAMSDAHLKFETQEEIAAKHFVKAMQKRSVKQIIYLSGLMEDRLLSPHLQSRLAVEKILQGSGIPTTIFRAAIIIGDGSASFEIIRDLVEKLPIMVAPRWVNHRIQPIAIDDVLFYLQEALLLKPCFNRTFDIGGPDILTYKEMMLRFAKIRGLKRFIFTVPVLTPKLSSYWLYFVTSTNYTLAKHLVESLKNEVICKEHAIDAILPHRLLTYEEAIRVKHDSVPTFGCFIDEVKVPLQGSRLSSIERLFSQGGKRGWYMHWAWEVRGFFDQCIGGVGLRNKKMENGPLKEGQALDFWRVLVADKTNGRLTLLAEMKLPGEAWLEWTVGEHELIQRAIFRPKGVLGRLYWYLLFPMHRLIFNGMAKQLAGSGMLS